jgi:predicted dehydrogenase
MIEAAIVGLGRWGRTLVEAVQGRSERLRFSHAVSFHPEAHRDFAEKHRLQFATLDAVLGDPRVAAVVLATPHSQHVDEVVAAAAAGKAVFCEKPLALSREGTECAVVACRAAGVVLGIGTDKRWFPAIAEVIRLADSGELGPLLHIEGNFSNEVAATMFSPWRDSFDETPAGGMTGTGIHVLDAMIRIAGPVRRVHARLLSQKPSPDPWDSIAVLLDFASGIGGTLAAVRSTPMFVRVHAFGRNGSAEAVSRTEIIVRKSGAEPQRRKFPATDSVRINLEAFADAVAGGGAYPIAPEQIAAANNAFVAIAEAVKSGIVTQEV